MTQEEKDIKAVRDAIDQALPSIQIGGRTYKLSQYVGLLDSLEKSLAQKKATEEKSKVSVQEAKNRRDRAVDIIDGLLVKAKKDRDLAKAAFTKGNLSDTEYQAAVTRVTTLESDRSLISKGADVNLTFDPAFGTQSYTIVGQRPPVSASAQPANITSPAGGVSAVSMQPTQSATPVVTPTPSGGAGGRAGGAGAPAPAVAPAGGKKRKKQVDPEAWKATLRQYFPSYANDWLDENALNHFGKDLIDLMVKVSTPGSGYDTTTAEGRARIQAEIAGTVYWNTTQKNAIEFDQKVDADRQFLVSQTKQRIANTYGDIGLDEATLEQVALNVARQGLTGLGEKQAVYNAVFTARQTAPQQAGRALQGADADRIRQLGRAYNFNVSDNQIQSILTGTPEAATGIVLTEAGLRERLQRYVKGIMPQLADQIDAGLTLEDIGGNYRRYAAQLLEQSEDQINMFEGPFIEAFGNKEQGQLSLGEWTQKVKSDARFGWQYTNQANQQATDVALTLARAFGKVG